MILMLSGEGKSDIGHMVPGDSGKKFEPGPMAWIVDRIAERRLDYSLLELQQGGAETVEFISESQLAEQDRPGPRLLTGLKRGKNTGLFTRNAQILGRLAKDLERARQDDVIAVLFRDADSTHTCNAPQWQQKVESMENGFALAEFGNGVPMVPRPKSEAWLLCAMKNPPYQHCNVLEDEPGNDNSPQALKLQLETVVGHNLSAQEQADWVRECRVEPEKITMPSFQRFREALDRALDNVLLLRQIQESS